MGINQKQLDDVIRAFKRFKEKGRQEVITNERKEREKERRQREEAEKTRKP